jgi:hypothetical protein
MRFRGIGPARRCGRGHSVVFGILFPTSCHHDVPITPAGAPRRRGLAGLDGGSPARAGVRATGGRPASRS